MLLEDLHRLKVLTAVLADDVMTFGKPTEQCRRQGQSALSWFLP